MSRLSGNVKQALVENIINLLREEADRSDCYIEAVIVDRDKYVLVIETSITTDKEKLNIEGYGEIEVELGVERTARVYKAYDVTLTRRHAFINIDGRTYEVGYITMAKTKDACFYQISLNDPEIQAVAEHIAKSTQA